MRTIAILNQKGGSGKTTTAVNLAAALGERGRRVLVVDLDPQASASAWLGVQDGGRGLLDALTDSGRLLELVRPSAAAGVEVVASSPLLAKAERELVGQLGGERMLSQQLAELRKKAARDYVFLDCPPAIGMLTSNALAAAGELLIPVEASTMALAGLGELLRTTERAQRLINPELRLAGILACRVDRTNVARGVVDELRGRYRETFQTVIRESVRMREAWSWGKPISAYAPHSTGAADYSDLAAEVLAQERGGSHAKA